jgi:phenylalanyl-tRNA synthetase beta chain
VRVSLKWLRDFVDIDLSPEELAERLTLAGLAVESVEYPGRDISKVYTGLVVKKEPHPNADRLVICQVSLGTGEPLQIVTGAPNVEEGAVVALAVEGARLAGGTVIKKARFRGVESWGMLCSWQELGFEAKFIPPDQAHGIMVLPPGTPVGADVKPLLGLDDVILDLEITPNRGDCLSILGVAREVAAILNEPLRFSAPEVQETKEGIAGIVRVDIFDPDLCPRYVARLFTNIKVAPSPLWVQERLRAAGIRPISNVVDITNYVMVELGQPLHAFDYDTLEERRIIVRRAREGETIVSLDGVTRELTPEMLVIADAQRPVAIAGVMGGLKTEVTEKTVNILLESACFSPVSVRRTSRALGLRSEASARFERGIDLEGCLTAANRAAQLLFQLGAGEAVAGAVDNYPACRPPVKIFLRPERVNYVLGTALAAEEIAGTLARLHFQVSQAEGGLTVHVPSYRNDVRREIDLVEEVARLHGYNKIPGTLPSGVSTLGYRRRERMLAEQVKDILTACGLTEVVTFSFTSPAVFDLFQLPAGSPLRKAVLLRNPLSEEHSILRTWLLPGLVDVLRRNYNRRVASGAVFELGRVFHPRPEGLPEERLVLAAAGMGELGGSWNLAGLPVDFYFLKGAWEVLFTRLGIKYTIEPEEGHPAFHPGRTARILSGAEELGVIGELHPAVLEKLELPVRVVAAELDFVKMAAAASTEKKYVPLPRFPAVQRDLAVVAAKEVPVQEIVRIIRAAGTELLQSLSLFDVYEGVQVKKGFRSLAFSLKFQAADRTLTVEEVSALIEKITGALSREAGAEIRGE